MGRWGKGDGEGDNDMVCNPHTMSSNFLSPYCLTMQCATHMLCHLIFNPSILLDDAACNPHAVLSIFYSLHIA